MTYMRQLKTILFFSTVDKMYDNFTVLLFLWGLLNDFEIELLSRQNKKTETKQQFHKCFKFGNTYL